MDNKDVTQTSPVSQQQYSHILNPYSQSGYNSTPKGHQNQPVSSEYDSEEVKNKNLKRNQNLEEEDKEELINKQFTSNETQEKN